ncbi:glycosyltransferase family A protein [Breoghania sp.]|uniref:glycosyltransferase family 2 protein n=1 Tax=Breoghania sp. TaxID=2065378 RepID=UPI002AA8D385|nr:glycosyltransferase family A protein [Breoghania sp.]
MKLSVLMPAYNAEQTIASALRSLLRQRDAAEMEILVADDGSSDRTVEIVSDLAREAPEIRLIARPHAGISATRNACLAAMPADTDFVAFLDADDLSPAGRFARDIAKFEVRPELEMLYCATRFFEIEDGEALAPSPEGRTLDGRPIQLGAGLFRAGLIRRLGPFDETLIQSEDTEFLLRVFEQEVVHVLDDDIGVYYRRNHGSVTDDVEQVRREIMRAMLRAANRRRKIGGVQLPKGFLTDTHVAELERWKNAPLHRSHSDV